MRVSHRAEEDFPDLAEFIAEMDRLTQEIDHARRPAPQDSDAGTRR
jgi:hypothetical protein